MDDHAVLVVGTFGEGRAARVCHRHRPSLGSQAVHGVGWIPATVGCGDQVARGRRTDRSSVSGARLDRRPERVQLLRWLLKHLIQIGKREPGAEFRGAQRTASVGEGDRGRERLTPCQRIRKTTHEGIAGSGCVDRLNGGGVKASDATVDDGGRAAPPSVTTSPPATRALARSRLSSSGPVPNRSSNSISFRTSQSTRSSRSSLTQYGRRGFRIVVAPHTPLPGSLHCFQTDLGWQESRRSADGTSARSSTTSAAVGVPFAPGADQNPVIAVRLDPRSLPPPWLRWPRLPTRLGSGLGRSGSARVISPTHRSRRDLRT